MINFTPYQKRVYGNFFIYRLVSRNFSFWRWIRKMLELFQYELETLLDKLLVNVFCWFKVGTFAQIYYI